MAVTFDPILGKLRKKDTGGTGTGDVVGPSSSTDNAIARYDGTTGKIIQNSAPTIADSGTMTLPASTASAVPLHLTQGVTPTSPTDGDMWFDQNGVYIQNLSAIHQLDADANAVGALSNATITLGATTGTIDVSSIEVFIYAQSGWQGNYMRRTVPAVTGLTLTDGVQNFLTVIYNSGTPIYEITTTASLINNSNRLLIATMWRSGSEIHWAVVNWGLSTATRLNDRLINIQRYVRSSGLTLGETSTPVANTITSTSGLLWYGIKAFGQTAQTSASNNVDFYYHSGGNWTHTTQSTYNNSQYDDGTNLQSLNPSKFTVNWIYLFVNGDGLPKLAFHLGSDQYSTVAAAAGASEPAQPPILLQMAILLGRIIVGTGASTASQIDSAFTSVFSGTAITDHNNLAGLQGGSVGQYYHLTSAQATVVSNTSGTNTGDVTLATNHGLSLTGQVIGMGTPSDIGPATTNSVTTTTHTHAISGFQLAFTWNDVTGTTQAMTVNNGYLADSASLVTLTLPSTAAFGTIIEVAGAGDGGWKVAQNSGQIIRFGNASTTLGTGGYLASTHTRDSIKLLCVTANTSFQVISSIGNITYV